MKRTGLSKAAACCIVTLLACILAPAACFAGETRHSAGAIPAPADGRGSMDDCCGAYCAAYGNLCVYDESGRAFDVHAAVHLDEDGYADLYLLRNSPEYDRLTAEDGKTNSLTIWGFRWLVSDEYLNPAGWPRRVSVRAVYAQEGTLQTAGKGAAPARLIWAGS